MTGSLVLRNARLVYADGAIVDGGLVATDGTITAVFAGEPPAAAAGLEELDAEGRFVLPGLIDPHVQLYPAPEWGEYATETGSAALGGVTTILKMHRDLAGYEREAFAEEVAGAESRAHVDFGFHLAIMSDAQIASITDYARDFELTSFKVFMAYKDEEGRRIGIQGVDDGQLLDVLRAVGALGGVVLVHAENQDLALRMRAAVEGGPEDGLRTWEASRPAVVEAEAVRRAVYLAGVAGCDLYVVHVTAAETLAFLAGARAAGARVSVETEPHYLTETVDSPAGLLAKVIPPVRYAADSEALWRGLARGEVDTIGSDHVAARRAWKELPLWEARLGFAGVGTILPVLLSEGFATGRLPLARLVAATSTAPARIFGLERKGELLPGKDADFVVIDLEVEREVSAAILGSASDFSVYEGRSLRGWPVATVSRGVVVARDGKLAGHEGHGRYLRRGARQAVAA